MDEVGVCQVDEKDRRESSQIDIEKKPITKEVYLDSHSEITKS